MYSTKRLGERLEALLCTLTIFASSSLSFELAVLVVVLESGQDRDSIQEEHDSAVAGLSTHQSETERVKFNILNKSMDSNVQQFGSAFENLPGHLKASSRG